MNGRPDAAGGATAAATRRSLLTLLVLLLLMAVSAASSSADSSLNLSGTWKSVYHCQTGSCAGQDFPAGPFQLVQAAGSSTVTSSDGTSTGTLIGHTLRLRSSASSGYTYTSTLTIAADGRSWNGTLSDSNGTTGTDTGTRLGKPVALAVSISSPSGAKGADIGDVFDVTVRVKARGGDVKDVRLSKGLQVAGAPYVRNKKHYISCGNSVLVTYSPPEASGFPLADGETRSFVFRVRAHRPGPSTLKVDAIGLDANGRTEQTAATVVHTNNGPLTKGGKPVDPVVCHACRACVAP